MAGKGLNESNFIKAFKDIFPPWKKAFDTEVPSSQLIALFIKIDANADESLSWDEFSGYILYTSKQKADAGHHGLEQAVFAPVLPDHEYNDKSCHHTDMIQNVKYCHGVDKYVTCGRDGTVRVW